MKRKVTEIDPWISYGEAVYNQMKKEAPFKGNWISVIDQVKDRFTAYNVEEAISFCIKNDVIKGNVRGIVPTRLSLFNI